MKTLKHEELKGGYTMGKKIIVDACELSENDFEVMTMYEDEEEIDCKAATTEAEVIQIVNDMIQEYAGELQKAIYNANMVEGGKYTLVYCNEFGFPVAQKITFHGFNLCTYAQYSDVVKMVFTPYRKRNQYQKYFYNISLMIFKGWQDLKEEDTSKVLKDDGNVKMTRSKYSCFDARYIDDLEKIFNNPVVIYKNYKTGINGKMYA